MLRSPSSFPKDPWGYLLNQLGHGYIVGGLPVLVFGPEALAWILLAYATWEVLQFFVYDGTLSDGVEDFTNVAVIGCASVMGLPILFAIHAMYLLVGWTIRMENKIGKIKPK